MRPCRIRIGVSLGDLPTLEGGGLSEFCLQIGSRLSASLKAGSGGAIGLVFHVKDPLVGCFGDEVDYLPVKRWQRLRHVQPEPYALWHSLHQLNKTLPPAGCPLRVVTVHDLNYLYGRNAFSTWRHQRRTLALMRRTDEVVAISHHTAADVRKHLGWAGPLSVIHNGARSFTATPQTPLPGFEAPARPFLFHLSRMSPSKNPQAILGLARVWPEMDFLLCGPPADDAKALKAANRLSNVHFRLGITDGHKAWAYAHCAGFLFPSLTEGFGLPPIEAMHFGKPTFLARRTCLPEIGGDAADYFDDFEPMSMRRVVEAGLKAAQRPGHAARVAAHAAQFDWDTAAAAYLSLYRRLLKLPAT
jgi:glycosyltransferase involved in cell wall biosynthesis